MIGYRYTPFSKPLLEFPPEELTVLRDVSEGWFVDYKSQPWRVKISLRNEDFKGPEALEFTIDDDHVWVA